MIEEEIISSVFSEEMFEEVKFLEVKDFQNPVNQTLWRFISEFQGDTVSMIARMNHTERVRYTNACQRACLGVACYKVSQMGLKLIELKFERLFIQLIEDLIAKSENKVEKLLLNDMINAVTSEDIFEISDHASEYIGNHASTFTKTRFDDFLKYRQKRIERIKQKQNEHS